MSEIIKTSAVVLGKMNYSDSSLIVTLYTEHNGKVSAIVKGARSPKSKLSMIVDTLNHIEVIFYKKESRELQIVSSADLISHYPNIKSDLESTKYAFAVLELVRNLTIENESNNRLFKGLVKILDHFENKKETPAILFARFFMFLITETGYEMMIDKCSICGKQLLPEQSAGYNFSSGFVCNECLQSHSGFEKIDSELFKFLYCLKNKKILNGLKAKIIDDGNSFLERYVKEHIPDFKGIQSLNLFK
ncbi:DNA repair protein RecO [Ignavibacterium album]|uniref:DNA repair protein RecO n=1 Tax=Ignavibacterium album TaxID=591197 RepID=UPI0026F209B0|nr:DNA repair protein RecO [Ignavibacterium album]